MTIAVMLTYENLHHLEKLLNYVSTDEKPSLDDESIKWLNDSIDLLKGKIDFSVEHTNG
jgi:hypothetical protein